jgi:hypothetical protein
VIREADHAHTDVIMAAMLVADGDINGPSLN